MALFTGVPYITETPAEAMRANRPAVNAAVSAYVRGRELQQRREEFKAQQKEAQEKLGLERETLRESVRQFDSGQAIKREELRLKHEEEARRIKAFELEEQAALVRAEILSTEKNLALKKVEWELAKRQSDLRDAPKIAEWQRQVAMAKNMNELMAVPFPELEDPDNIKRVTDTFAQYRTAYQARELQEAMLKQIWTKNDAKKDYAEAAAKLPVPIRDRFIQDMDAYQDMINSMMYSPQQLAEEKKRITNLYGLPGANMVRPPTFTPQPQQGPVPKPQGAVGPTPAPTGTNAPAGMNFMGLDEATVREYFRNK